MVERRELLLHAVQQQPRQLALQLRQLPLDRVPLLLVRRRPVFRLWQLPLGRVHQRRRSMLEWRELLLDRLQQRRQSAVERRELLLSHRGSRLRQLP